MRKDDLGSNSGSAILSADIQLLIQNGTNKCSEDDRCWLSTIKEKSNPKRPRSKIQQVPPMIREANRNCYDPLVVSIGPYHHGRSELQFVEDYKYRMAWKYAKNDEEILQILYTKVKEVAKAAKECYNYNENNEGTAEIFKDDDKFTRMMFLDGCFVLQFIDCISNHKVDDLEMKNNSIVRVKRDLFLLENQIPFLVLKELMLETIDWKILFKSFIEKFHIPPREGSMKGNRKTLSAQQQDHRVTGKNTQNHQQDQLVIQFEDEPAHLLGYAREQLIGKNTADNIQSGSGWSSYRSAKELKTVGINFKRSKTNQFMDVKFENNILIGELYLPPITVDDSTKSMFLNMVAYEACPDSPDDFGFTSYLCFLDSLIDHAEDVKELRSKGILLNFLGSDQQVAELFNEIADNLVPNPTTYAGIQEKIEKHYKNKMKNWLAEFWHTHFTSPWTLLAFVGAIFALVLSVIQTYKSMFPPSDDDKCSS